MTQCSARACTRVELTPVRGIVGDRWCVKLVGGFIFMASPAGAMDCASPGKFSVYAKTKYLFEIP